MKSRSASWRVSICLLTILVLSATAAWARPTTPKEARAAALNWLARDAAPLGALMGRQIKEVQTFNYGDVPAYYAVHLDPAGLVFLSADDLVEPIIGFLPDGVYDPSPANPLGALVSQDIPDRVLKARQMEAQGLEALAPEGPHAKAQRKWEWLLQPDAGLEGLEAGLSSISDVRVASFVQSCWLQTNAGGIACYNYYTPPYSAGSTSNYPCGCVATAMSQLMRYWQFPTAGVGTGGYTITVDGVDQTAYLRGGNGSGGAYSWSDMVLVPSSGATTAQRQAIGNLTHDAGLSVNMSYTSGSSSAYTEDAAQAFINTFGYSHARVGYNYPNNIPAADRNAMVNANLQAQYPVIFGISGPPGGHAIVCDGYGYNSATIYHHLNLGWAGSNDAWYNLPMIDTTQGTYTTVTKCIYNVYTSGSGEILAGRVTDSRGNPLAGVTVTATTGGITYPAMQKDLVAPTTSSGIYAIPKLPSGTTFTVCASKTGYLFASQLASTGTSSDFTCTTGNRWEVNFTGKRGLAGVLKLLLLN